MRMLLPLLLAVAASAMKPYFEYGSKCRSNSDLHGLEKDVLQCSYDTTDGFIRGLELGKHACTDGGDMRFRMRCEYNHTESSSCSVHHTSCDNLEGKSLSHLIGHDAVCPDGFALTQWGLTYSGCSSSNLRLRYKCCSADEYDTDSTTTVSTSCREVDGKKIQQMENFGDMKCGNNEVVTALQLKSDGCSSGKAKFVLTCAAEERPSNGFHDPPTAALAVRAIEHAGVVCQATLYDNVPPSFCYKKGGDGGIVITGCKDGYVKLGALCYRKCKDGYSRHTNNVCAAGCGKGWKAFGIKLCKKRGNWGKWKNRKTYWVTGHSVATHGGCPQGRYRQGLLCYRDCNNIGLKNCGIGACSYSGSACGTEIWDKINKFSTGALTGVSFVASLGATFGSSTLAASLSGTLAGASYGSYVIQAEMEVLFDALMKDSFERATIKKMTSNAVKRIDAHSLRVLGEDGVEETCTDIYYAAKAKSQSFRPGNRLSDPVAGYLADATWPLLDTFKIGDAVEGCTKTDGQGSAGYRRECATAVMESIATVDPTGVAMMISSLMGRQCDVPGRI
eukprot:TRINITY_DN169_c1_g1_i5.p1 TRINITY_DN169_c1_g1~~TRINITY_DN169_c1_g1_i5.p1  ORF type:complete len:561 (+),score=111.47 TRINITY_DN169_c1_g1_i5:53-1735(+)